MGTCWATGCWATDSWIIGSWADGSVPVVNPFVDGLYFLKPLGGSGVYYIKAL